MSDYTHLNKTYEIIKGSITEGDQIITTLNVQQKHALIITTERDEFKHYTLFDTARLNEPIVGQIVLGSEYTIWAKEEEEEEEEVQEQALVVRVNTPTEELAEFKSLTPAELEEFSQKSQDPSLPENAKRLAGPYRPKLIEDDIDRTLKKRKTEAKIDYSETSTEELKKVLWKIRNTIDNRAEHESTYRFTFDCSNKEIKTTREQEYTNEEPIIYITEDEQGKFKQISSKEFTTTKVFKEDRHHPFARVTYFLLYEPFRLNKAIQRYTLSDSLREHVIRYQSTSPWFNISGKYRVTRVEIVDYDEDTETTNNTTETTTNNTNSAEGNSSGEPRTLLI